MTLRELYKELKKTEKESGNLEVIIIRDGVRQPLELSSLYETIDGEFCIFDSEL